MTKLLKQLYKRKLELQDKIDNLEIEWENLREEMDGCSCSKDIRDISKLMNDCDYEREELEEELADINDEIEWEERVVSA
ncbi:MAG: hypothetical protein ACXABY_35765 [Candidatus Thorarchaeota archaeon]|jgi:predicted  nucleic acid-binding Zn-ribbon protein